MIQNILIVLMLCVCSGCAVVPVNDAAKPAAMLTAPQGPFDAIGLGMKRADVLPLLDREVLVGYEKDQISGDFFPVKSRALYSTEVIEANGVSYQVDLYITADLKAGAPEDGDLMPLIYQNGILVGKGRAELEMLRKRG